MEETYIILYPDGTWEECGFSFMTNRVMKHYRKTAKDIDLIGTEDVPYCIKYIKRAELNSRIFVDYDKESH